MAPRTPAQEDAGMAMLRESGMLDDVGANNDFNMEDNDTGTDDDPGGDDDDFQPPQQQQQQQQHEDDFGDDLEEEPVQQQPQQRQQRQQQQPPQGRKPNLQPMDFQQAAKTDAKGNIVDAQGNIIAKAGVEARFYARIHEGARQQLSRMYRDARGQVNAAEAKFKKAADLGMKIYKDLEQMERQYAPLTQLGLQPQELVEAATIFNRGKSDPLGVLKELLTRAAVSGIDLTKLGLQPGSIDPTALMNMVRGEIQNGIKPVQQFTQQQQQRQQDAEVAEEFQAKAADQVQTFFSQNPAAVPYAEVFQRVLEQPHLQNMTLDQIWDKLRLNLMSKGIDPNNPPRRMRQQQQPRGQLPRNWVPGNGGNQPPMETQRTRRNKGPAPVTESYEKIVSDLLNSR